MEHDVETTLRPKDLSRSYQLNDRITAAGSPSLHFDANELPTVSVIILNYNGQEHLKTCLTSLANLNYPQDKLETIIVDNASADDSVAWLKQHHPAVKLLVNPTNLGFAAGINRGVTLASGTHLAFLNPDMRVDENWLMALWQTMTSEIGIACAGSIVLNWTGDKIDYAGRPQDALNLFPNPPEDSDTVLQSTADVPLLFASGGAMLISRAAFVEVGGFDEDYFLYHEDVDLGWRLWIQGYRILRSTRSIVFHKGGASSKQLPLAEMLYFVQKYVLYTILKNADDDQLGRLLSSVLWFLVDRELWWPPAKASLEPALRELIREVEAISHKRQAIQTKRKYSDTQIFQVCGHPLAVLLANDDYQRFERYLMNSGGNASLPVSADGIVQCLTQIPHLVESFSGEKLPGGLHTLRTQNEAQPIEFDPGEHEARPSYDSQHELNSIQASRRSALTNIYVHWRRRERARSIWRSVMPAGIRQWVHNRLHPRLDNRDLPPAPAITPVHATSATGTSKPSAVVTTSSFGDLTYQCNVCGATCRTKVVELGRETSSCQNCGSTVRIRSIVHVLSMELFGQSLALSDFPVRPDMRGIGLSDSGYSDLLPHKLNYTNTFYHKEPKLDITAPIDPNLEGSLDFLISTEVFEHVVPPVSRAFENARRLLKPDGVLILSVPYTLEWEHTLEHFPELYQYKLVQRDDRFVLENVTREGRRQIFKDLVFHGGEGATLEMRIFSKASVLRELTQAGFQQIKVYEDPCWKHGIYWSQQWSLPLGARLNPLA
jgi:GT2 family glycosyltransferase